uniref:Uncharacterized protein n=1 Tax=Arundo donax TaxID=35708 RepID=A0A0A9G3R7_ARUDO
MGLHRQQCQAAQGRPRRRRQRRRGLQGVEPQPAGRAAGGLVVRGRVRAQDRPLRARRHRHQGQRFNSSMGDIRSCCMSAERGPLMQL